MTHRILDFLENEATDYIVTDIQRLAELRPKGSKGIGSCATAEAMFLFAVMEYFGYLIRDDRSDPRPEDTEGSLSQLFANRVAPLPTDYLPRAEMMVKLYRHGLMHQIFPQAAGIRKAGADKPLFSHFDGLDHLNVDRLAEDVLALIGRLKSDLPRHNTLCAQMSQRMDIISERDIDRKCNINQKQAEQAPE